MTNRITRRIRQEEVWNDHFAWSDDSVTIIGLTPTGRATIEALQMNSPNLQNWRSVMRQAGLHPPTED